MKKLGAWGMLVAMMILAFLLSACVQPTLAGEVAVRAVTTAQSGEYTQSGGGTWLLKAVQSGATGGVLRVKQDFGIGGAGVTTRDIGNLQTVKTSRVVGALPTDVYLWNGHKITLTNTTAVASHTVFLILEKQDTE